jgi:hypothetical protein
MVRCVRRGGGWRWSSSPTWTRRRPPWRPPAQRGAPAWRPAPRPAAAPPWQRGRRRCSPSARHTPRRAGPRGARSRERRRELRLQRRAWQKECMKLRAQGVAHRVSRSWRRFSARHPSRTRGACPRRSTFLAAAPPPSVLRPAPQPLPCAVRSLEEARKREVLRPSRAPPASCVTERSEHPTSAPRAYSTYTSAPRQRSTPRPCLTSCTNSPRYSTASPGRFCAALSAPSLSSERPLEPLSVSCDPGPPAGSHSVPAAAATRWAYQAAGSLVAPRGRFLACAHLAGGGGAPAPWRWPRSHWPS